jgi:cytidylate kinase
VVAGKGTRLRLNGYSKDGLQGDVAFAQVAQECGASLKQGFNFTLVENWQAHRGGTFNFNDFSDTFLTLAALAPLADKPTTLTGIGHTRKQETDRVLAMATELERLGVKVVPTAETLRADASVSSLTIHPSRDALIKSTKAQPVSIHTYEDHRMAMSFGILGSYDLHGDGRAWLSIEDPGCVNKTFPNFFSALERLRGKFVCVAVDGGAASGKSSTSRLLAAEQGLLHVDTGSHYRAVTLALLRAGGSAEQPDSIPKLLDKLSVSSTILGQAAWVSICGTTPSAQDLRRPEVTASVSAFSAIPAVRNFLLNYQRDQVRLAEEGGFAGVVMEGRDIGSVVLPQAEVRIFLEADTAVRSARRAAEGLRDAIAQRDQADASRATAPLTCPAGAVRIDNTQLSLIEVVGQIGQHIKAARLRA